ncbi:MAG: hypothetical protein IT349_08035 [Candidatus Eisenbacteria bacterium]|nr:hypothetical protein [Candidatus Eisenbacteria bacterium]
MGREAVFACLALTVVLAGSVPDRAWAASGGSNADSTATVPSATPAVPHPTAAVPWRNTPGAVLLRSTVLPGWGQLKNGRPRKAALVLAGQAYLVYRAVRADAKEQDWRDKAAADSVNAGSYLREARYQADRRHDFSWWSAFAWIYNLGDAYVDAHLGKFGREFEPQMYRADGPKTEVESTDWFLEPRPNRRGALELRAGIRLSLP